MKTLLCLYPGSVGDRVQFFARHRKELHERGVRTLLADDYPSPRDAEVFDEVIELPPIEEVSASIGVLSRIARTTRIDAVFSQTEAALAPGAWLAHELELPGASLSGALACLGKHVSRERLSAAGVPVPEFRLVSSAREVREFALEYDFPVVLKATASSLGRLVTKVDDASAVDGAVERLRAGLARSKDVKRLDEFARSSALDLGCDPFESFLVERFFDGEPLETDGLVLAGRATNFGVVGQTLTPPPRFYVECYRFPDDRPPSELAHIEHVSDAAIAASRLSTTGYSIELRARDGDVRVIEVNARLGEDDAFGELFASALGFEPWRAAIELALGELSAPPIQRRGHWALAYQCGFVAGTVRELPSQSAIEALAARGIRAGATVRAGDPWHVAPHPDAFPHLAYALARDAHSSRRAAELALQAARSLRVRVQPDSAQVPGPAVE